MKTHYIKGLLSLAAFAAASIATSVSIGAPGTLDDRSATYDEYTYNGFYVYKLGINERSNRSGDTTSARIERRLPALSKSNNARRWYEGEYRVRDSKQAVIAQVHAQPTVFHGNVVLVWAKETTTGHTIYNDVYRSSDGKRTSSAFIGSATKNSSNQSSFTLKLDTGYNSNSSKSDTTIYFNGVSRGTFTHFNTGNTVALRYGAYRSGSEVADVRIKNPSSGTYTRN